MATLQMLKDFKDNFLEYAIIDVFVVLSACYGLDWVVFYVPANTV